LIYHASLVGQAGPKNKAKVARMLAAKTALSLRVDALGELESNDIGIDGRTKVEARINMLEGRVAAKANKDTSIQNQSKFKFNKAQQYSEGADVVMAEQEEEAPKKRKIEEVEEAEEAEEKPKKEKKEKKDKKDKKEKKEKKDKKEKKEKKDKKSKKSKD
jgi:nucleolar protein 58